MATERERTTGTDTGRRTERTIPRKVAAGRSATLPKIISVCATANPDGTGDRFLPLLAPGTPAAAAAATAASRPVSSAHPRWWRDQPPPHTDGRFNVRQKGRCCTVWSVPL